LKAKNINWLAYDHCVYD